MSTFSYLENCHIHMHVSGAILTDLYMAPRLWLLSLLLVSPWKKYGIVSNMETEREAVGNCRMCLGDLLDKSTYQVFMTSLLALDLCPISYKKQSSHKKNFHRDPIFLWKLKMFVYEIAVLSEGRSANPWVRIIGDTMREEALDTVVLLWACQQSD